MAIGRRVENLRPLLIKRARAMIGGKSYGAGAPLAEDLVQIVMKRLVERGELAALPDDELRRYALTSLHHAFLDECARRRRELVLGDLPEMESPAMNPEQVASWNADIRQRNASLTAALGGLSRVEEQFLRACLETGSAPLAQRRCGWPPGGSSSACERRNRIVARLRRELTDE